jgi:glutaminyl-tRNA synthetase
VLSNVFIEPALGEALPREPYQFLRKGYFCLDENSSSDKLIFNRTVGLKDTWAKEVKKG